MQLLTFQLEIITKIENFHEGSAAITACILQTVGSYGYRDITHIFSFPLFRILLKKAHEREGMHHFLCHIPLQLYPNCAPLQEVRLIPFCRP